MNLDRTTYEAWLLDRLEGNLTPGQEQALDAFLAANPDLKADLHGLPAIEPAAPEAIDWKNELKKRLPPTGMPDKARVIEFLVARSEGDLDAAQMHALDKLLYEHPEFKRDAERIAASRAEAGRMEFPHKPSIERHFPPRGMPDKHRLTDFLIAAQEGDLTAEQHRALAGLLAEQPEAQREARLIAAARAVAEPVVFRGKEGLKKRETRVITLWQRYAVAASIAVLLGFAWWMMRAGASDGPAFAGREKTVGPQVPGVEQQGAQGPGAQARRVQENAPRPQTSGTEALKEKKASDPAPKKDALMAPPDAPPVEHHESKPPVPVEPIETPAPEPLLVEVPVVPDQQEAQRHPEQRPEPGPPSPAAVPRTVDLPAAFASTDRGQAGGTPIGTVLANTVRQAVLTTEERTTGLDRNDALAMANKAIGAVTGGKGGVEAGPKGGRSVWKLRLGQHLAISASKGR